MKPVLAGLIVVLSLSSCTRSVTLYTDDLFRGAAPEVVQAWQSLAPLKDARSVELPPGSGRDGLEAALQKSSETAIVVVGLFLSPQERRTVAQAHPKLSLLFITSIPDTEGLRTLSINPADAWNLVARAAAAKQATATRSAVAFFPSNASSGDLTSFEANWKDAGGGPLTAVIGPRPGLLSAAPDEVFVWGGNEVESLIASLPPTASVHGNPGLLRPPGTSGFTWTLRKQGLGDFLWNAALNSTPGPQFLPLETLFERR